MTDTDSGNASAPAHSIFRGCATVATYGFTANVSRMSLPNRGWGAAADAGEFHGSPVRTGLERHPHIRRRRQTLCDAFRCLSPQKPSANVARRITSGHRARHVRAYARLQNASITAFAAGADFLADGKPEFAQNMRNYYTHVRNNDKVLTHTLVNPTFNYEQAKEGKYSEKVALQVVEETDAGIVVNGARLLATWDLSRTRSVFPSTLLKASPENLPFAFAFAIPINTPGVRLLCRDSYDHGKSHFDAPLASRFEEMDSVVTFNKVLVPWERVFMYREPLLCNRAFAETNAVVHMMHQVVCGKLAKAEFLVGLLCAMAKATGKDKDMAVKSQIAEAMFMAETIRPRFSAEAQAHPDQRGTTCRSAGSGHFTQPVPEDVPTSDRAGATARVQLVDARHQKPISANLRTTSASIFKPSIWKVVTASRSSACMTSLCQVLVADRHCMSGSFLGRRHRCQRSILSVLQRRG